MTDFKKYDDLTFSDQFMFAKVMRDPVTCKEVLELLLEIKLKRIEYIETEKTLDLAPSAKGIRIDAYVEDEFGTVYDVEMQTTNQDHLPKRSRYYQGIIDLNSIEKGAFYQELKRSFVIFICTFDWFKKGNSIYTFNYTCKELPDLQLGDETTKIFINAAGNREGLSKPQQIFLDYIMGCEPIDDLTKRIEDVVERSRTNQEWRREYVKLAANYRMFLEDGRRTGLEMGRAEGRAEGLIEGYRTLIIDNLAEGISSDRIIEKLQKYFNLSKEEATMYFQRFSPFNETEKECLE